MSAEPSIDAFLNGRFEVFQPQDGGHRAGLDAVLLAAAVQKNATGRLADFGAGSGVAGVAALCAAAGLQQVDLHEIQTPSAALARRTRDELLPPDMASKISVIEGDVRQCKTSYDHIICNPPFNDEGHRTSPNASRAQAHAMDEMGLEQWVEIAAKRLAPSGTLAMIFRPDGLPEVAAALATRLGAVRVLPIHPKADAPATRIVVTAIKGRRTPLTLLPGFIVHEADGSFTPLADAIFRGEARLAI